LVKGRIIDAKGNGLAFTTIMIKGTNKGTSADYLGYFLIKANPTDILQVSHTGFLMLEVPASRSSAIVLKDDTRMTGEVVVIAGGIRACSRTKSKKEIRKEKKEEKAQAKAKVKNSFTIYPNPLISSSEIHIKWTTPVSSQAFYIYDFNGNLIQKDDMGMESQKETSFRLKNLVPGVYILKVADAKTGKSSSQKFIVE
jgi:hypothetical protein